MATGLRMFSIDYGREQQPKIGPPQRVRRDGGRANCGVRDGGFGASVGLEGLPLGCAGEDPHNGTKCHRDRHG